jgi:hypothetical protein
LIVSDSDLLKNYPNHRLIHEESAFSPWKGQDFPLIRSVQTSSELNKLPIQSATQALAGHIRGKHCKIHKTSQIKMVRVSCMAE